MHFPGTGYVETSKDEGQLKNHINPEEIIDIFKKNIFLISGTEASMESIPFSIYDTTAGSETEMQAAVAGKKDFVDLPITIKESDYYANLIRRSISGDTPKKLVSTLERFIEENTDNIWENSFVQFERKNLNPFAQSVLKRDLLADKNNKNSGQRDDVQKFVFNKNGEEFIRIPVSYLLKLALADIIGSRNNIPRIIHRTGYRLMNCFTNDNTSPETHSFHIMSLTPETGMGRVVAKEKALRYLFSQLLIMYANKKFGLIESGQEVMVYLSPHTSIRQKRLNDIISDSFYRELFMNPCLSGWNEGKTKHSYMHLCHEVLSRSQLNGVAKLRDAGIIINNLVVLPNISNASLANNGTHVSMGSQMLLRMLSDPTSGFTHVHEKYVNDLVVKIVEHFLPLFVCIYSASPYRIDFWDFHPEKVLSFLPHELDYTHLRMLWRRWKKKTKNKFFGNTLTPFGPLWLDKLLSKIFALKGDFVHDFRLIDYLVCIMSTEQSPALNGITGNTAKLKNDLEKLGIFHKDMSLYLLFKPREYNLMGFSGFEGRYYSLFESFEKDMGNAVSIQNLVIALAFHYIIEGKVTHNHIPDSPFIESERRQMIFDGAIGIPTFYVRADTKKLFLKYIVSKTKKVRNSRRYPGYLRVKLDEYLNALFNILREDGCHFIDMFNIEGVMEDLKQRLDSSSNLRASTRLTNEILYSAGVKSPFELNGERFNMASERFYYNQLRKKHIMEAFNFLEEDFRNLDISIIANNEPFTSALNFVLQGMTLSRFLRLFKNDFLKGEADIKGIIQMVFLMLIVEYIEDKIQKRMRVIYDSAPVYRAGNA